jgi:hypothetical protein
MKPAALLFAAACAACATPALSAPQQPMRNRLAPFALPSPTEIRNALHHASHHAKRDTAQYTIIDEPNAAQGYGQGTFAFTLNSSGAAAGWYEDWLGKGHGFERASDGSYKTIDVGKTGTVVYGINDKGAVAGNYVDLKTDRCPGFLLTPKGKTKKFEPPDAETGCGEYTADINNNTSISGDYQGADGLIHGFLRTKNGTITEFSVPGAINTYSWWMNDSDAIASPYTDSNGDHGYIRAADGTFTTFDAPGGPGRGNIAARINNPGEVQGDYFDNSNVLHALIRKTDGAFIVYDAPDAVQRTGGEGGINNVGDAAGVYLDANGVPHGYIRASNGALTEFDPPGSIWTAVWDINDNDVITGFYMDANAVFHGYLRIP